MWRIHITSDREQASPPAEPERVAPASGRSKWAGLLAYSAHSTIAVIGIDRGLCRRAAGLRKTSSTSSSIRVNGGLHDFSCCWQILARKAARSRSIRISVRHPGGNGWDNAIPG